MTSLSSGYHLRGSQYSQGSAGLGRQMDGGQDKGGVKQRQVGKEVAVGLGQQGGMLQDQVRGRDGAELSQEGGCSRVSTGRELPWDRAEKVDAAVLGQGKL